MRWSFAVANAVLLVLLALGGTCLAQPNIGQPVPKTPFTLVPPTATALSLIPRSEIAADIVVSFRPDRRLTRTLAIEAGDIPVKLKPTGFESTGFNFSDGVLTIVDDSSVVASLHFLGSYATDDFNLASDGHGGLLLTFR